MSTVLRSQELIALERRGWEALCSADAVGYYSDLLADEALMAFPFGILDRGASLQAMANAQPWQRYEMQDPAVVWLGADAGVVVYAVTARREGQEPFSATMSSTYARHEGRWTLAFHQQSSR